MSEEAERPPLGIKPKKFWIEARLYEIKMAIIGYLEVDKPIPKEWLKERNQHLKELRDGTN